ncbi:uncharacterized protein BYT42DRAFT_532266 [Radiomyces spectabilis]|uniref:uncharacterized protein n=1 Tax=Radiomyces spectabilis TaxID=64574 RepID=UPI00222067BF|nr:uncharacterized protein BYT42DRAFT_532266 [Radiomyces spectabilis]KAI8379484.1 hypothetical protein BYT42DRAFT_532266 [Radiomyces spectabilis]
MPNNKKHTLKAIKNRDAAHPYSRKAHQVERAYARKEKLAQKSNERAANNPKVERWLWFRFALDEALPCATKPQIHDLIATYLERNDEEIERLEKERQIGKRPKTTREQLLLALRDSDNAEYVSGFELPDLTNVKNVKALRDWNGDKNAITKIRSMRLQKPSTSDIKDNEVLADVSKEKAAPSANKKVDSKSDTMDIE